jgi:hypothetical protein
VEAVGFLGTGWDIGLKVFRAGEFLACEDRGELASFESGHRPRVAGIFRGIGKNGESRISRRECCRVELGVRICEI